MTPATILLLMDRYGVRADLDRRGAIRALERTERPSGQAQADLIDALCPRALRGAVLVLSDEVFPQTIELPSRTIARLPKPELDGAIAYEAQLESGMASSDAVLAWHRAERDRRGSAAGAFRVAQLGRGEFQAIADTVTAHGGALLAVAHPGGLPFALVDEPPDAWCRVEDFGEMRFVVRGSGRQPADAVVVARGAPLGDEPTEHLAAQALPVLRDHGDAVATFDLRDADALSTWLGRWALAAARRADTLVLLRPPAPGPWTARRIAIAIALAGLTGYGCYVQHQRHAAAVAVTRAAVEAERGPIDALNDTRRQIAAAHRQLNDARLATPAATPRRSDWSDAIPATILGTLASSRPAGLVVDRVDLAWRGCRIEGRATTSAAIDALAATLAAALVDTGYVVSPAARRLPPDGAPLYEFRLEVTETAGPLPAFASEDDR